MKFTESLLSLLKQYWWHVSSSNFIHLKVHTEYSLCDGIVRIPELIEQSKNMSMPAVAMTDLMNLFGLIKFYKKAVSMGVKPLIAADFRLFEDGHVYIFSVYAINAVGYLNIRELLSKAYQYNQISGVAYINREWLIEHNEGLLVLSGAKFGDVGQLLLLDKEQEARHCLKWWVELFPDRYYIELQKTGLE